MALARNPLLLTIIAYLFTDTDFVLPHSRTEFYEQASDVLLRQWKEERNKYKAPHKVLVLQRLAVFNQDRALEPGLDRRALDLTSVLIETAALLPALNVAVEHAQELIDEIVERSGLLLAIDGGLRYQFAHLTLQEFFAAKALDAEGNALVERFRRDPDTWRETVKLWCGLPHDGTAVIESIYAIDPITAFECLADAQKVSPDLASQILEEFEPKLQEQGEHLDGVIRAFAAVAADVRPRGQQVLGMLERLCDREGPQRAAAARALSMTNVPAAAAILDRLSTRVDEAAVALVDMGDIAIGYLVARVKAHGDLSAIAGLKRVGTARAAGEIASLLWHRDRDVARHAAAHLAVLLRRPDIEEMLRHMPVERVARNGAFDWVWEPFPEPAGSSLPETAGRIAYLVDAAAHDGDLPTGGLDLRIVAPLLAYERGPGWSDIMADLRLELDPRSKWTLSDKVINLATYIPDLLDQPFPTLARATREYRSLSTFDIKGLTPRQLRQVVWQAIRERAEPSRELRLLSSVPEDQQGMLWTAMYAGSGASIDDWRRILTPGGYQFAGSVHHWAIVVALMLVSAAAVGDFAMRAFASTSWIGWAIFTALGIEVVGWWGFLLSKGLPDATRLLFLPTTIADAVAQLLTGSFVVPVVSLLTVLISTIGAFTFAWRFMPPLAAAALLVTIAIAITLLSRDAMRRVRDARNPLRGLLEQRPVSVATTVAEPPAASASEAI
jgi:hypothetical protein